MWTLSSQCKLPHMDANKLSPKSLVIFMTLNDPLILPFSLLTYDLLFVDEGWGATEKEENCWEKKGKTQGELERANAEGQKGKERKETKRKEKRRRGKGGREGGLK